MNILFVVPYVPNLVRTRSYNLIRNLALRGHRVTVLTLWTSSRDLADLENLKQHCYQVHAVAMPVWRSLWNCIKVLPADTPLQSVFSWNPELLAQLNGDSDFDVVHVEHLRGARYGLALKERLGVPVVWDSVDCISHLFRQAGAHNGGFASRIRTWLELERTERYERWLLDKFTHVLVTSPVDKKAMQTLAQDGTPGSPISILGNGVDLSYFRPPKRFPREPATLVVSGKMSYHANVAMVTNLVENIMPHVWRRRPEVKLWVVGKDPAREIQVMADNPAVTVTGYVEDVRSYLSRATVAVTPVAYGAGIQNKVLEAMSCATPVVTTPQAVSALGIDRGQDVLVAEKPEAFADCVLALLDDPDLQQRVGRAGLTYVQKHHHWSSVVAKLEGIYEGVRQENGHLMVAGQHHGRLSASKSVL